MNSVKAFIRNGDITTVYGYVQARPRLTTSRAIRRFRRKFSIEVLMSQCGPLLFWNLWALAIQREMFSNRT